MLFVFRILMTAKQTGGVSLVMQYVGRYYVPYINHKYGFSGSLWEGRFKSNLIDSDRYLFACMRYIELNPVRAGMVEKPQDYVYSSYHCNALNLNDMLVKPHSEFIKLSDKPELRSLFYANLFKEVVSNEVMSEIKASYQSGMPVGSSHFKAHIEQVLERKLGYTQRGRPKKDKA